MLLFIYHISKVKEKTKKELTLLLKKKCIRLFVLNIIRFIKINLSIVLNRFHILIKLCLSPSEKATCTGAKPAE